MQSEVETLFGFSRAHVSETISDLMSKGGVVSRREGNLLRRIWLTDYFPFPLPGKIRVGILPSSEYVLYLACALRVCRQNNVKMIIRVFNSSGGVLDSLLAGSIDVALAPFYSQIIYSVVTHKIKLLSSIASGGSSVFANSKSDGTKLETSDTSTMILLSRSFLGTLERDVEIYTDPAVAVEDFETGKFRFITIWEPYCTKLRKLGKYKELMRYEDVLSEMPCCVSSFRSGEKDEVTEILRQIDREYGNSPRQIENETGEIIEILGGKTGIEGELIKHSLKSYKSCGKISRDQITRYMEFLKIPVSAKRIDEMLT